MPTARVSSSFESWPTHMDICETFIDLISADLPSSVFVYKFNFKANACTVKDVLRQKQLHKETGKLILIFNKVFNKNY